MQARELLSLQDPVELLEAVVLVTSKLADVTSNRSTSLFPSDIQTTNVILDLVVDVLERKNETIAGIGIDEVCMYSVLGWSGSGSKGGSLHVCIVCTCVVALWCRGVGRCSLLGNTNLWL